jgi:hypothetical protein
MSAVTRLMRQKVFAGAAVAALLTGGAVAAVNATGQSNEHQHSAARRARHVAGTRDLATAASYLGISSSKLSSELRSGKTLAQVAAATSGKSAAGLVEALVASKRARLAAAGTKLPRRVTLEVNRSGGPQLAARTGARAGTPTARVQRLFASPSHLAFPAAAYLGLTQSALEADLRSGKTLAQVAEATAGKSKAGLIDALVSAKQAKLSTAVTAGRLTQAKVTRLSANLDKRVSALVSRNFAASPGR